MVISYVRNLSSCEMTAWKNIRLERYSKVGGKAMNTITILWIT